jgi:FKBP-type peptidyl-prolyl cis-trans isomerase FklB
VRLIAPFVLGLLLLAGAAHAQAPVATAPPVDPRLAAAQAFLAGNGADPAVTTLPSGLQYKVVSAGPAGPSPKPGDAIKIHYEGALPDGTVFDSTLQRGRPAMMILEDLIPAWIEAIPLMKVGDEWTIYAPSSLGYGARGVGPIPPYSVLVFRLHLLGMLSAD